MKTHQRVLYICIFCFISLLAEASETFDFVSQDIGLDPAKLPFGKMLADYQGAVKVNTDENNLLTNTTIDWYRIDALAANEKEPLRSQLEYGFSGGKLVAIQFFRIAFKPDAEEAAKAKVALDELYAKFRKLDGKGIIRQDKDLKISYDALCTSMENIAARITIALPNGAATQAKSTGSISTASVTSSGKTSD